MTKKEATKLAEEVFDEEYSGLDKDSFLIGFQEAYNALTTLYKDKFELVRRMREAQSDYEIIDMAYEYAKDRRCADRELVLQRAEAMTKAIKLEDEVDEYLKKMEDLK